MAYSTQYKCIYDTYIYLVPYNIKAINQYKMAKISLALA